MTPALHTACARAMHVVTTDGRVLRAGRALLFVLRRCGWAWLAVPMSIPPLVWLAELGYLLVSRNRRFFGRFMFRRE